MNKVIINFLAKFIHTFNGNWFYIIMSMFLPFTLYYVGQGQELIRVLRQEDQGFNIFFIFSSFALMFYSIWVVNPLSTGMLNVINRIESMIRQRPYLPLTQVEKEDVYKLSINFFNYGSVDATDAKVMPIRHFANLPAISFQYLLVFGTCDVGAWAKAGLFFTWLILYFMAFNFSANLYSSFLNYSSSKWPIFSRNPLWSGYGLITLFTILIAVCWRAPLGFQIASNVLIAIMLLFNNSLHFYIEHLKGSISEAYAHGRKRFMYSMASVLLFIALFYYFSLYSIINTITPIAISITIFGFYIMVLDGFLSTPSVMAGIYFGKEHFKKSIFDILIFSVTSFFILSILFSWGSNHDIRQGPEILSTQSAFGKRDSLPSYYHEWKKSRSIDSNDVVTLIAGQGGGSRAAAWMYLNVERLDSDFVFAISTVSGSSSGANQFIYKKYIDLVSGQEMSDPNFCKNLYTYNYLSQSFWGLLLKDGIIGKLLFFQKDRNHYHQEDEMKAFRQFYNGQNDKSLDLMITSKQNEDFVEKWKGKYKFQLPLLLANSATTQAGKRAIFSPISYRPGAFLTAIDAYEKFHTKHQINALLSSTCVNASQSFPFTSAYSFLEGVGNFIDGGLYDNTGANTLLELYQELKRIDPKQKFKIVSIQSYDSNDITTEEQQSLIFNTISSASKSPFSGHSYYWSKALEKACHDYKDSFYVRDLKSLCGEEEIPLGIYLSDFTMDKIYDAAKKN